MSHYIEYDYQSYYDDLVELMNRPIFIKLWEREQWEYQRAIQCLSHDITTDKIQTDEDRIDYLYWTFRDLVLPLLEDVHAINYIHTDVDTGPPEVDANDYVWDYTPQLTGYQPIEL
jgi:hypothetical protein